MSIARRFLPQFFSFICKDTQVICLNNFTNIRVSAPESFSYSFSSALGGKTFDRSQRVLSGCSCVSLHIRSRRELHLITFVVIVLDWVTRIKIAFCTSTKIRLQTPSQLPVHHLVFHVIVYFLLFGELFCMCFHFRRVWEKLSLFLKWRKLSLSGLMLTKVNIQRFHSRDKWLCKEKC